MTEASGSMFRCVGVHALAQAFHKSRLVVLAETLWAKKANPHPGNVPIPVRKSHCSHLDPEVVSSLLTVAGRLQIPRQQELVGVVSG